MKKAFIRYDNLEIGNEGAYSRIVDLDEYYNHYVPGWDFISTRFIDSTLHRLTNEGYEWAVVSALGNFLRQGSIDDRIINNCIEADAPLAGHLLDRFGYYNIDPQFFCVNLKKWDIACRPEFTELSTSRTFTSVAVERSPENVHDNYTPLWLKKGQGEKTYSVDMSWFGSKVVQRFLEFDYNIINIDDEIRKRKIYLYPNHNSNELWPMFSDINYEPKAQVLQHFMKKIKNEYDVQYDQVYVLNSEPVILPPPIDHYFGVCGGLKAVAILNGNNFHDETKVDLFDISTRALDYQKYLVENWDGDFDNYHQVYKNYVEQYPDSTYAWRNWNTWEHEVDVFLSTGKMTKESFKEAWGRYRKLDINYTQINLLDNDSVNQYFDKFTSHKSKNYYVWVSNAYRMEHTMVMNGAYHFKLKLENLRNALLRLSGTVRFESCNTLDQIK